MKKEIRRFFQELWNQLKKTLADKCGELPFGVKPGVERGDDAVERDVVINDTRIHIRSIFTGQTRLDEAINVKNAKYLAFFDVLTLLGIYASVKPLLNLVMLINSDAK